MKKKVIKKILALLIVTVILTTDFFAVGSHFVTYASQNNKETNNDNVNFSAYFKNEEGNKVDSIDKSIKSEDLKLYAEISVKNEGYFNGNIEIKNSNFNIKNEILSKEIASIKGNKVNLKQINAGETVEIELAIEPVVSEEMTVEMLSKTATVQIKGTYMESTYKGLDINAEKFITINYLVDDTAKAELETEIITNKLFTVNGINQKIIQMLVKTRLTENQYPTQKTVLTVNIPQLGEKTPEIKVVEANGRTKISSFETENNIAKIVLTNLHSEDKNIVWNKKGYEEVIVTFIYDENVDTSKVELTTNSEIKVYNSDDSYKAIQTKSTTGEEIDNTIMANTEFTTTELYKGQLYANTVTTEKEKISYKTTTTLVVTDANVADGIIISEGLDKFILTDNTTLDTDAKYVKTEINKQQLLKLLGNEGTITIKNGDTTLLETTIVSQIKKENIIVNYTNPVGEIQITTSTPITEGILEIQHEKEMTENAYSREQIKQIKEMKVMSKVNGKSSEQTPSEAIMGVKETISKAELTILNKGDLSSTEVNNVTLGISLNTEDVQYDLYKNPIIVIQLPSTVESVEFNTKPTIQNVSENDEIEIQSYEYDNTTKQIKITVRGEQTTYPEGTISELYIPLDLNITLSRFATTQIESIEMTYINANASEYYGGTIDVGVVENLLGIEAPTGLIKYFNLSSNTNKSISEEISQRILNKNAGDELDFEIALVNNTEANMENVKILGTLPTEGVLQNTLSTTLKGLTAQNATIYFTENSNATKEINDATNGWTTELLPNAKLYLIDIGNLAKGNNYTASVKVQVPNEIINGLKACTQYEVIYNIDSETKTESSRNIWLEMFLDFEVELVAHVGNEILNNGDIVKEGEVVRYTATVTNMTNDVLENIQLKAEVPNGTVVVELAEDYVYNTDLFNYEEKTEIKEMLITIPTLGVGETYKTHYEVRANMDAKTSVTEIANKLIATHNETQIESEQIKNKLQESDIRVTLKKADDESKELFAGSVANYQVCVENFSNKAINDYELEIISDLYDIVFIKSYDLNEEMKAEVYDSNKISINEIPANGKMIFEMHGEIANGIEQFDIYAVVRDSKQNYRSNVIIENLPKIEAEITLSSPQNNWKIKQNDKITYNVTVKNNGVDIDEIILIEGVIADYLEIESVSIDGKTILQTTDASNEETYTQKISNEIIQYELVSIPTGKTMQMEIIAKVKEIPLEADGKVVTSKLDLKVFGVLEDSSEEVKHTLDSNQKNVITGTAWIDEDADGKKETTEGALAGITVKLYDNVAKTYLKDGNNIVSVQTGTNGEYIFTKIPNGLYTIVFEHGMQDYEPTKYQANKTESSESSKAQLLDITVNGENITVTGIKLDNLNDEIITNANMGLKNKETDPSEDDETNNPNNPENPENPENPTIPEIGKKEISGYAWLDLDRDGEKDDKETMLRDIKIKLYNVAINGYVKDKSGKVRQTLTDAEGKYKFADVEKGEYILIFEYDTEEYEPTTYLANGVETAKNSKVVLKKINIDGKETITAVTDTINVQENVFNINIGLREKLIFDLELNKYISRIVVQNSKETKTYDYENKTFAKVEIHRKRINGSLVVLEYTIKVKNNGEVAGYAKNIVDYLPSGLTFSSELNADWYLSGNYLYTKGLENIKLNPGEEKEVKLILTKTMTNENIGLINNRAEIYQDYNEYGIADIDSTVNNKMQNEDDIGSADVIILVATGGGNAIAYTTLIIVNIILIGIAVRLMVKNKIIRISNKKGRR